METDWLEVSFGRIVKGGKKGFENSAFAGLETVKALNEGNGFFLLVLIQTCYAKLCILSRISLSASPLFRLSVNPQHM